MSCWSILGISPTKNISIIENAYNEILISLEGYESKQSIIEIEDAYKKAISLANISLSDLNTSMFKSSNFEVLSALINSSINPDRIDSIPEFTSKLNDIYINPELRFKKEVWIEFLSLPIIDSTLSYSIEKVIIEYISTHKFLPNCIYTLLDTKFKWLERESELKSLYASDIIDNLLNILANPIPLSYDYLTSISAERLDEYLLLRENAFKLLQDSDFDKSKSYLLDAYSIYNKDLALLKMIGTYYLNKNDNLMSLNYFREAINIDSNDLYSLSKFGQLLTKTHQYSKAISYLEKYIKRLKNTLDVDCLSDLAYCYYHTYELNKAKDIFVLLSKLRPWDLSFKAIIENINNKLTKDTSDKLLNTPIYHKYLNHYLNPFIIKLEHIYTNFNLRINPTNWEELFTLPIASNEILFYLLEEYVIGFVTKNKNIPKSIFIALDKHFNWDERHDEITSLYPSLNTELLFSKLHLNEPLSYDSLINIPDKNIEQYVQLREKAYSLVKCNSIDSLEYLDKSLELFNGDFELFKLYGEFFANTGFLDKSIENFKIALSLKEDDYYSCCSLALLYTKLQNFTDGLYYLKKSVNTPAGSMLLDNEDFLVKYAICYYYTNDLYNAKKYIKKLYKLNPNLPYLKIFLNNINDRLAGKNKKQLPIDMILKPNLSRHTKSYPNINKIKNILNTIHKKLG